MNEELNDTQKIALLIFAHDESTVIEKTVSTALKALESGDELLVIADNCTDNTAILAEEAGAQVYTRDSGSAKGKGEALVWFVKYKWHVLKKFSRLVILDADSLVPPDFVNRIKSYINDTDLVMQCFVCPVEYNSSPVSSLIALSELVEQSIFERIKSKLGWSIRLRGTGMVISPKILLSVSSQVDTVVEDLALSLLLAERQIKVKQLMDIEVFDPKPTETAAASRQRARWFRGQWAALWLYRHSILKIISQGPGGWSLIGSLFLKPRWLMMMIKILLGCMTLHVLPLSVFIWSIFSIESILVVIGIFQLKEKRAFLKAIIYLPGFVLMWLKGILLSFQRIQWLRVRQSKAQSSTTSFSHQGSVKSIKLN